MPEDAYALIREQFEEECKQQMFSYLYENIFSALYNCLCRIQMPPGTVIQEKHLADMLNVSRTPLRQAFLMLTKEGLLLYQPGIGYVVSKIEREDFLEVFAARKAIETCCAELAAQVATPEEVHNLEETLWRIKQFDLQRNNRTSIKDFAKIELDFHSQICLASKNNYLIKAYKDIEPQILRMRNYFTYERTTLPIDKITSIVHDEHLTIYLAIRNRNTSLAHEAMRIHLQLAMNYFPLELLA